MILSIAPLLKQHEGEVARALMAEVMNLFNIKSW